ncbi:hypothetical protein [Ruegeria sp.]|uniref:hypothetical protein n=1 Tax=Ruegeria sp. TaxID=1879320 RepID=UPI003B00727D
MSGENICRIVNGEKVELWNDSWISAPKLKSALDVTKILVKEAKETPEVMTPEEVELFKKNAWQY